MAHGPWRGIRFGGSADAPEFGRAARAARGGRSRAGHTAHAGHRSRSDRRARGGRTGGDAYAGASWHHSVPNAAARRAPHRDPSRAERVCGLHGRKRFTRSCPRIGRGARRSETGRRGRRARLWLWRGPWATGSGHAGRAAARSGALRQMPSRGPPRGAHPPPSPRPGEHAGGKRGSRSDRQLEPERQDRVPFRRGRDFKWIWLGGGYT